MLENQNTITLKEFINNSYNDILKSMEKDKYVMDYNRFDLFREIEFENEVVGFIALEKRKDDLIVNECYIKSEKRGNNLFYEAYSDIVRNTPKKVFLRKPTRSLINVLLKNNLAFKLKDDIIISYVDFIVKIEDFYKNSKIKQLYRKAKNKDYEVIGNLYDVNLCAVLVFDYDEVFSKQFNTLIICQARKSDLKKYSIRKKLNKIQPKYINNAYDALTENITDAYDFFKASDCDFSNAQKTKRLFLNSCDGFSPDFEKARPNYEFISTCPVCGEIIIKSSLYCQNCGFDFDSTVIRDKNLDKSYSDEDDFDMELFDAQEAFKKSYSYRTTTLNRVDFGALDLDKKSYNRNDEKKLNRDIATYMAVRYSDVNPTTWNCDYSYNSYIDPDGFDIACDEGYIEKIMAEEFPKRFENFSKEELIRESMYAIEPDTSKENVIKRLMDEGEYSWVVSQKGYEFLKNKEVCEFFASYIKWFNFYEFKLFYDANNDQLSIDEIGDEYMARKLEMAFAKNEYDIYLIYMDYHFYRHMARQEYDNALVFLSQRIIYEINTWHLYGSHTSFDEALSLQSDELLFQFKKHDTDLDLGEIYDRAFNEMKFSALKYDYNQNFTYLKRLLGDDDVFDISDELMKREKKKDKMKSLF